MGRARDEQVGRARHEQVGRATGTALIIALALCGLGSSGWGQDAVIPEDRFLTNIRQVTFEGRRAGEGYFSADGSLMIFQSEREPENPFYQIYVLDLETGDTTRVSPGHGKTTCAWIHPNMKKVMFASSHDDPRILEKQKEEFEARESETTRRYAWSYDEYFDIYEAGIEGDSVVNLTNARGYDAEGSYSPDGSLIAFASNRHAYTDSLSEADAKRFEVDKSYMLDIYIMNSDGSNVRRLTDVKGYDGGPFFSPDGRRICWRRFNELGDKAEVHTMNIDGSDVRRLTGLESMSWAPYYHPSGDYIIFSTNVHGFANFELYLVDTDGRSAPVRVTTTNGFDGLPVFFPDGKRLAFTSTRNGNEKGQIFFCDWNDAEARRALGLSEPDPAATDASIRAEDIKLHVDYLASPLLAGRMTGSRGEIRAASYIQRAFEAYGLEPAGDGGNYQQRFEFTAGMGLGAQNHLVIRGVAESGDAPLPAGVGEDWRPLSFSKVGSVASASVAFAGYGIVAPADGEQKAYDSFGDLDVSGKWVMVLRYVPENVDEARRSHLRRYANLRFKAMVLQERGALGMIVVSGPSSKVRNQLVPLRIDSVGSGRAVSAVSITDAIATKVLAGSGRSLAELQEELDEGEVKPGFELPGITVAAHLELEKRAGVGRNVLGRLSAPGDVRTAVVIGAHYDHLGHGEGGSSLAHGDESGGIHFGADDNASGVAGLLEAAQWLGSLAGKGKLALKHDIIFAAWSGEEIGLLGSSHFVNQLPTQEGAQGVNPPIVAYLNMDMIGRLRDSLTLQGTASSPIWTQEIERRNAPVGLALKISPDCFLPTDTTPFYLKGVPILSAFTGSHPDYHTPRDTADRVETAGAARVSRLMALIARGLATRAEAPAYTAQARPQSPQGSRGSRVWLGTIPAYGDSDEPGLKLDGAMKGGPAEKAGVQAGDVIVGLNGHEVANIYDFMNAMKTLAVGKTVPMVVKRGEKRIELEITPASRE